MRNIILRTDNHKAFENNLRQLDEDFTAIISGNVCRNEAVQYAESLAAAAAPYSGNKRYEGCLFISVPKDITDIPGDCFCAYVLTPTIKSLSIISYVMQHYEDAHIDEYIISKIMRGAMLFHFCDTGYDEEDGLLNNLTTMVLGGMPQFLAAHPDINKTFSDCFEKACARIINDEKAGSYPPAFATKEAISAKRKAFIDMLCRPRVFVYGTLLSGRSNHDYYLSNAKLEGNATLSGYALYDLGSYPGIVAKSGAKVKGELYVIENGIKNELDKLEGQGVLYDAVVLNVECNEHLVPAWAYVYRHDVEKGTLVSYENQPWVEGDRNE